MLLRDYIRTAREKLLLSQEALAQLIDVSTNTINRIEHGIIPRAKTLRKLSHALGISVDSILSCEDILEV